MKSLLKTSPSERPSLEQILAHEWMALRLLRAKDDVEEDDGSDFKEAVHAAKKAVIDKLRSEPELREAYSVSLDQVASAVNEDPSVKAFVQIVAKRILFTIRQERILSDEECSGDNSDVDVANKVLSQRSNNSEDGSEDDEKFVLEEECIENVEQKDLSNGGFRDYSVSQGIQEELAASYVAFNENGMPIKTFFHAKTFNGNLGKSKKKGSNLQNKSILGSTQQISISTYDETPVKHFQSCRMLSLQDGELYLRKSTLMAEVDEENSMMHESILHIGKSKVEDGCDDAKEFDRESFNYVRLNKSMSPPSMGYSPREIQLENLLSPSSNFLSPIGDSSIDFIKDDLKMGFSSYTSTVRFPTIQPPLLIDLPKKPVHMNSPSLFKKPEEDEVLNSKERRALTSELMYTHQDIQIAANADLELLNSIKSQSRKPPTGSLSKATGLAQYLKSPAVVKPRSTRIVEVDVTATVFGKYVGAAGEKQGASVMAKLRPLKQRNFAPHKSSKDTSPIVGFHDEYGDIKSAAKLLPKWASQDRLAEVDYKTILLTSPLAKKPGYVQPPKSSNPRDKVNSPKNSTTMKQHKSQSNLDQKKFLNEANTNSALGKNRSRSRFYFLEEAVGLRVSNSKLPPSKVSSSRDAKLKRQHMDEPSADLPMADQEFVPRSLDLLTGRPRLELISAIKEILKDFGLDPYVVGSPH